MNIRERIDVFLSGERPDQIPYTIYDWEWMGVKDDKAWQAMFEEGLGITWHIPTYREATVNVERREQRYVENNRHLSRITYKTPVGEIYEIRENDWVQKYLLETPEDYKVMEYIVKDTEIIPTYEEFLAMEKNIQPYGIALVSGGRTPLQTILVDMAGLEQFALHLYDYEDELLSLYDVLLKQYRKIIQILAEGPGKYVSMDENFTAETLGPSRYEQYLVSVYNECYPIIQSAGKVISCHYDGKLKSCKELVAKAPIDVIESLTPPSEGDMTLRECREAWPNKIFWSNIKVSDYNIPEKELYNHVLDLVAQGTKDGSKLAFEVSEHLPARWKESMPVVLKALRETRI